MNTENSAPSTPDRVRSLMLRWRTDSLVNASPEAFKTRIDSFLQLVDHEMEGFQDPQRQRDLSIKFHWGHHHDFGAFALQGRMAERHIDLLAAFIDQFKALPLDLSGCKILDIGCWTGGTSLLLCAMGAEVVAIEEVRKYVDAVNYMKDAFGLKNLQARNLSLYDCTLPEFQDAFDYVLFAGVLYHVTDPVLALRLVFNCLKDGGKCLLETGAAQSDKLILEYEGPGIFHSGDQSNLSRGGWNWFMPSAPTLKRMMQDVGFTEVDCGPVVDHRAMAVGKRLEHMDMMRGGLSQRSVR